MSTNLEEIRAMERDVMRREINIEDPSECFYCKSKGLSTENKFCPNCRFPQGGTELEQKNFFIGMAKKRFQIKDNQKQVNRAKIILFVLAGLNFIAALYYLKTELYQPILLFSVQLIVALIYFGLGLWCKTKPFLAITIGLSFYLFLIAAMAIVEPASIISGFILKILIIGAFIYAIKGVKEAEKIEKELETLKTANDFTAQDDLSEMPN